MSPGAAGAELAQSSQAVSHFDILAKADDLYKQGEIVAAENLYRQIKPDFPAPQPLGPQPIYEIEELSPAGQVYWRNAQEGMETQIFLSLQRLTENYPEFIPGYLKLAEVCQEKPEACERYAGDEQPKNTVEVLERATTLYPDEPELLKAKITALADAEQFLEASIAARQFVLLYPDYFDAPEFARLADEYRERYQSKQHEELLGSVVGTIFANILKGAITGDWSRGVRSLDAVALLLQSESDLGQKVAEQYKQKLSLLEDPEVLNYVKGRAGRLTDLMGRDDFEYEDYIVKDDSINAFALPGGKIFVNTGAIINTNSEAELAGLLAHEIAHAVLSHGIQRVADTRLLANLQEFIPFSDLVTNLVSAEFSRKNERQADILGSRVLNLSIYAADGLRNMMVTLKQKTGNASESLFATHPAPAKRIRYLENLIQRNGYNRYAYEGMKKHQEIQNKIKKLSPEESQDKPAGDHTQLQGENSSPVQSSPQSTQNSRTIGNVPLAASQTRNNVAIRLEGANVSRSGSFTANLLIENRSDRSFGFLPLFVKVINSEGESVPVKISFETEGDGIVQPGDRLAAKLFVFGQPWRNAASQNLTLIITEGTGGGRLFRIPF